MNTLALKMVNLPLEFHRRNNISIYNLVQEASDFHIINMISEEDLYVELISAPNLASNWILYSEDKKSHDGWYFKAGHKENYLVGCLGDCNRMEVEFTDILKACAYYIKMELNSICGE